MYLVLLIYLSLLFFLYDMRGKIRYKDLNYIMSCIVLICVAGFRYRIGFDTINYMENFNAPFYPTLSDFRFGTEYGSDILWVLLNSIAKSIGGGFYTVQFLQAAIVNIIVFWFIKRHSPKPFLGILLYFLFQWWNYCFEAMRESIAIAFYLFGLDALISENSLKKYYLRVWPALFFHTFGFITLIFPLIKYLKVNRYLFLVLGVFAGVIFSASDLMNSMAESLTGLDSSAATKAVKYIDSDMFGEASLSLIGIISMIVSRIVPISVLIIVLHKSNEPESDVFIPYLICYILVVFLRIQVPIFFRFYNYFEVMLIVAITQAVSIPKTRANRTWRFIAVALVFVMILLRGYELTEPDGYEAYKRYMPYNSIFTEDYNEQSEFIFRSL